MQRHLKIVLRWAMDSENAAIQKELYNPSLQEELSAKGEHLPSCQYISSADCHFHTDIVAGLFDDGFLKSRKCAGFLISHEPIRCAVSIYNDLSEKKHLTVSIIFLLLCLELPCSGSDGLDSMQVVL